MEVKPKTKESTKKATNFEDENKNKKKTNKDDVMIMTTSTNAQDQKKMTLIKGHLKIFESLRQAKTKEDLSPKSPRLSSSSSSYVMKIKMGNYKNLIQRSEDTKKMEHNHHQDHKNKNTEENTTNLQKMMTKKKVWDCESTLYDSFELNSFNRQLDSAISSSARSMSMPHVSFSLPPPPQASETTSSSKTKKHTSNKISRTLQKLIKSMFKHNHNKQSGSGSDTTSCASFKSSSPVDMDKYYVVFDKTGSLTTIPESGETTTEMGGSGSGSDSDTKYSLVRKTVSERIPLSRLTGITCS